MNKIYFYLLFITYVSADDYTFGNFLEDFGEASLSYEESRCLIHNKCESYGNIIILSMIIIFIMVICGCLDETEEQYYNRK